MAHCKQERHIRPRINASYLFKELSKERITSPWERYKSYRCGCAFFIKKLWHILNYLVKLLLS